MSKNDNKNKLVTIDDRVEGLHGKYVGKERVQGFDHYEPVYKIFYKPPIEPRTGVAGWFKERFSDEEVYIEEHPKLFPESAIEENVPVQSTAPGAPDQRTVLRYDVDENAGWADSIDEEVKTKTAKLAKRADRAETHAATSDSKRRQTQNEAEQEEDKNNDRYHGVPEEVRRPR